MPINHHLTRLARLLPLLVAGALLAAPVSADDAVLSVGSGSLSVAAGGTVAVPVRISGIQNLFAFQVQLSFDPSVLQVVDMDAAADGVQNEPGDFLTPDIVVVNLADNSEGIIEFGIIELEPSTPKSGSGILFTAHLRGVQAGQVSALEVVDLAFVTQEGQEITVTAQNGEITVTGGSGGSTSTPTPTRTPTATPTGTPEPQAGQQAATATRAYTNTPGSPATSRTPTPAPTATRVGTAATAVPGAAQPTGAAGSPVITSPTPLGFVKEAAPAPTAAPPVAAPTRQAPAATETPPPPASPPTDVGPAAVLLAKAPTPNATPVIAEARPAARPAAAPVAPQPRSSSSVILIGAAALLGVAAALAALLLWRLGRGKF